MAQVTNWDKAEVKCRAVIKRLAEMPCPHCNGRGGVPSDIEMPLGECNVCDSTGALFPWLWRDCPRCDGDAVRPDAFGAGTVRCGLCDGRGWLINYDISIQDVLVQLDPSTRVAVVSAFCYSAALRDTNKPSDVELAFWQAVVEKAGESDAKA